MKFRTEYKAAPSELLLNPEEPVVLLGSCFTDYIGKRMRDCRWRAFPNTCGTLFNPRSISNILNIVLNWSAESKHIEESIVEKDGIWMSWLMDSKCNTYSPEETNEHIIQRFISLNKQLQTAHALIITFGTAWIYELKEKPGYVVTNCHKFPTDNFVRKRLSVEEIVASWEELLLRLRSIFPSLRVIFTVSPVRHLKDGFEGNSRSKAILQLACEILCEKFEFTDYFPSYEIMNDDLRDYRFYATDLVHPSEEGIDYIWEKFQDRYLSPEAKKLLAEGEKVTKRLSHRPIILGDSNRARSEASKLRNDAMQCYSDFLTAHPSMLRIDDEG